MVCNYSSPARAACPPSIYLVSGHASCSPAQLPDTVAAKQLAEIHSQGYGETLVPLSWDQVTNTRTCLLIVRNTECGAGAESEAAKTGEQQPSCRGLVAASLTTGLVTHSTADQPCDPGEWPCRDRSRSQHLLRLVESRQAVQAWSFRHCGGVT